MVARILILLLCSLSLHSQVIRTYSFHTPTTSGSTWTNLLNFYSMEETAGSTCVDSAGTDDGTITGATINQSGVVGLAYSMDGTGDVITLATGNIWGTGTFTLGGWFYPDQTTGVLWAGATNSFTLIMSTSNRLRVMIEGGGGSLVATLALTQSAWNFVSVVRNGDNFRVGVNGSYENLTFAGQDFTGAMNTIGEGQESIDFDGLIDVNMFFSDEKTDTYLTNNGYNAGAGKYYAEGED